VTVEAIATLKFTTFPVGRWLAVGGLAVVLIGQFGWWGNLLNYLDHVWVSNFGTPLHYIEAARAELASTKDILIFNADLRHSAWTWEPLMRNTADCVREVIIPEGGLYLRPKATFSAFIPTNIQAYPLLQLYQNTDPLVIPLRQGEAPFTIYPNETAPEALTPVTDLSPVLFDNGAALTGYHFEADRLYLQWTLNRTNSPYDYQYSVNYYDATDQRLWQHDTSFYTGRYWCSGDSLITWLDAPRPAHSSFLRVSMYRLQDGQIVGSSVLDAAGNAASPWFDLPLAGT
jgi:hypothetical protein